MRDPSEIRSDLLFRLEHGGLDFRSANGVIALIDELIDVKVKKAEIETIEIAGRMAGGS